MANEHDEKLRICLLAETFYPEAKDGLTQHAYQLAESLISKGAELFVITRKMERESRRFELVGNVPVTRIPPVGRLKGKGWKAVGPLLQLLTIMPLLLIRFRNRYDVIMVSGIRILSIPAVLMSIAFGKISIIKIESPSELHQEISTESLKKMNLSKSSPMLKLLQAVRNPLVRRADYFVAISSEIKQQLIDIGVDTNKIFCISNGIDITKFSPPSEETRSNLRRKLSLPPDAIIVVYTGRLVRSKGILVLVEIWNKLLRNNSNIHLLLVGSGKGSFDNCEDELHRYIKEHKLEEHISITGSVDNVNEYLMASNIFVLPSEYEGFSLALLEGLACALPAVATRVGGATDLIQDCRNGILIDPNDKQGLETAIGWMLEKRSEWEAIGKSARERAERYSIDVVANKYIDLFERLVENRNLEKSFRNS